MPLVRPVLEQDVKKLETESVHEYRSGDGPFSVSIFNDVGLEIDVTLQVISTWSTHWHDTSTKFGNFVERDRELRILHGKVLFVWEEIHRYTASRRYIKSNYGGDYSNPKFYEPVECICIDPRRELDSILDAMNHVYK